MPDAKVSLHGVVIGRVVVRAAATPAPVSVSIAFRPEWPGMWEAMAREIDRK